MVAIAPVGQWLAQNGAPNRAAEDAATKRIRATEGATMPNELHKPRDREPSNLERYGFWQDALMFIGLFLLGAVIATWLWGG